MAAPPEKVSVTFNKNPLGWARRSWSTTPPATNWADGAVEIVDNVASQKLKAGAPAGAYTVKWRVVSSDSPPDRGQLHLHGHGRGGRLDGGAAVPTMGTAQPGITLAPEPLPDAAEPFPWSVVIFVGTAVGILVALALMAKRRLAGNGER